jgi:hypothetical protein
MEYAMTPINHSATTRTRRIIEDLEALRENLLALSDDIWFSIDHNDPQSLEAGVEFKRVYNLKAATFDQVASELSALVQQYTSVKLDETEETGLGNREQNDRIVADLNREEPHSLDEDFTYKRPHGMIFDGQGTTGITTWQRLYELFCRQLIARDGNHFRALIDHPEFVSNRGHHTVTTDALSLRKALAVGEGLFVESNLSANGIRDIIRQLLAAFDIPKDRVKIFLRQDRDAGRDRDET